MLFGLIVWWDSGLIPAAEITRIKQYKLHRFNRVSYIDKAL